MAKRKALVIGGGIFGVCAAIELARSGVEAHLIEQNNKLMQGATSVNQNRFHLGYHYPRSVATAKQCLEGAPSFKEYFGSALIGLKENYYAIGKNGSRVNFEQYINFCESLSLPCQVKYPSEQILRSSEVSGCIAVDEQIINLSKMQSLAEKLLKDSGVKVHLNKKFKESDKKNFSFVVNATYSNLDHVNRILKLPVRKFRYDVCNVAVLNLPKQMMGIGVTIMDGEFYSVLPYGKTPYHLLWSVKGSAIRSVSIYPPQNSSKNIANFKDDTYIPLLKGAELVDVLRVVKILRPDVELSDERVSDLIDYGNGYFAILSAKLNTCVLTARRMVDIIHAQN